MSSSEKLQLPKEPLDESCLPCPIASNISLQQYNSFVESKEISGYKLDYKKGTVYMVEMCSTEHEAVVEIIGDAFRDLCPRAAYGSRNNAPIQILGQSPGRRERAMKAILWRQGVAKQKWHFGTVDKNGNHFPPDTNVCNTANDPNYIINIPVSDIFYDPPVPATGYTPLTGPPLALYNAIVAIDLYEVQQAVLMKQEK
ncbi:7279_t:CDS:2 [Funneliformis mosseae]|uniref:7279_t:CDS:1 n=1 Tax=Funneliformis mosseae TaxID=27381 RepID=A0A9N9HVR0_FUNMO|nr:7279_t:CDS:2 [Funneliformis mosseae]